MSAFISLIGPEYPIGSIGYSYNFTFSPEIGDEDHLTNEPASPATPQTPQTPHKRRSSISLDIGPDVTLFLEHPPLERTTPTERTMINVTTGVISHKSKSKMRYRNHLALKVLPMFRYELEQLKRQTYQEDQIETVIHNAFLDSVFHSIHHYTKQDTEQFMTLYGFSKSLKSILDTSPGIDPVLREQIEQELSAVKADLGFHNMRY